MIRKFCKYTTFTSNLAAIILLGFVFAARPAAAATPFGGSRTTNPPKAHHLFGSSEVRNNVLDAFTKWTGVIGRTARNGLGENPALPCRIGVTLQCRTKEWKDFIAGLKGKDRKTQLEAVNRYINQSPYITDIATWGITDYWETLGEFIDKDGDCEDYAIAKYYSLKALGFDISEMRIVVLEDENLHVPHAVLAVFLDGNSFILDNQIPAVVRDTSIVHYRPIYSINEQAWWFHRTGESFGR